MPLISTLNPLSVGVLLHATVIVGVGLFDDGVGVGPPKKSVGEGEGEGVLEGDGVGVTVGDGVGVDEVTTGI